MKFVWIGSCAVIGATLGSVVYAAQEGTLLFTQPGTQIVDATGTPRPALRGDVLQSGERLLTPPGAISQIKLPDGSLIGMRPDSELKMELPPGVADNVPHVVSLVRGAARIIGAELMDAKKISHFTFHSGPAVLKLQGADLESAVIPPGAKDGKPGPGDNAPGSYQRLLIGTGSVGNGKLVEPLAPRQVSFVGGVNVAPVTLASVSTNLFTASRTIDVNAPPPPLKTSEPLPTIKLGAVVPTATIAGMPAPVLSPTPAPMVLAPVAPVLIAVAPITPIIQPVTFIPPPTLTIIQPVNFLPPPTTIIVKPCTQFIGKTCIR